MKSLFFVIKNSTQKVLDLHGFEITCSKRPYNHTIFPGHTGIVDFSIISKYCHDVGKNANIQLVIPSARTSVAFLKPNGDIIRDKKNSLFSLNIKSEKIIGQYYYKEIEVEDYSCSPVCDPHFCCKNKDPDCKFVQPYEGCGCKTPSGVVKACYPGGDGWVPVIEAVDPQSQWMASLVEELEFA